MSRALITGASGFIGGHLVQALVRRGTEVRCLVRPSSQTDLLEQLDVELFDGNVNEPERLNEAARGVDVVYHLAGLTAAFRTADLMRVNEQGTENVYRACAQQESPPVVVSLSSLAAAGPSPRGSMRTEADRPSPVSLYGRSKRAGEVVAQKWAGDVPTTIIRPAIVFGPRDRMTLSMFQPVAWMGMHPVPGLGLTELSLIHVSDLVDLIVRAAERGERLTPADDVGDEQGRGYYFACCDEHPNYRDLGRMMAGAMDRGLIWLPLPFPIPQIGAGVNEVIARVQKQPPGFSIDKLRDAIVWSWACSSDKACRQLEWSTSSSLQGRLRETVEWYVNQGWLSIYFRPTERRKPIF